MILDAVLAIILIISVVLQSGKSSGLAGALGGGGGEGLFTGKAKSSDAMLARVTMVTGSLFGIVTLVLAKITG